MSGDGQHLLGEIDQRHLELILEMEGVVTAPAPELENRSRRRVGHAQQKGRERCFLPLPPGCGDQRPPRGEITLEAVFRACIAIMILVSGLGHLLEPNWHYRSAAPSSRHALFRRAARPRTYAA